MPLLNIYAQSRQKLQIRGHYLSGQLISQLIDTLNNQGIRYCHWKSNYTLAETMSGDIDLDLLVARRSLAQTMSILLTLGFKPAVNLSGPEAPGIYHYYGFDPEVNKLIHVHMFNHVLTGESFIKSHQLPFEDMLLETDAQIGAVRVPTRSAELVLFTIRTMIKYGSLFDLIYLRKDEEKMRAELRWLRAGADLSIALELLKNYCPVVEEQLFLDCLVVLEKKAGLPEKIRLAQRLRERLKIYSKDPALKHLWLYAQLVLSEVIRRLNGKRKNRRLSSGGAVIAFVGPEATGKSTLVSTSQQWLGDTFAVCNVHAGKPPASWLTAPLNMVLPLFRKLMPHLRTSRLNGNVRLPNQDESTRQRSGLTNLLYALRSVSVAYDRRQLLVRVRRQAANGLIVICDRYPSEEIGAMDSPRLVEDAAPKGFIAGLCNRLARIEGQLYKEIPAPDTVLRLTVSIEVATQRNRDRIKLDKESDEYVESRHRQSREWRRAGTVSVFDINTDHLLDETILNTKQSIWRGL